jgi:hypothetical protein
MKMIEKKIQNIPFNNQFLNMPIMFSELIQKTQKLFQNINLGEQYSWEKDGSKVIILYLINL